MGHCLSKVNQAYLYDCDSDKYENGFKCCICTTLKKAPKENECYYCIDCHDSNLGYENEGLEFTMCLNCYDRILDPSTGLFGIFSTLLIRMRYKGDYNPVFWTTIFVTLFTTVCIYFSTITDAVCNRDCDLAASDGYYCACTIGSDEDLQCGYNTNLDEVYCIPNGWKTWQIIIIFSLLSIGYIATAFYFIFSLNMPIVKSCIMPTFFLPAFIFAWAYGALLFFVLELFSPWIVYQSISYAYNKNKKEEKLKKKQKKQKQKAKQKKLKTKQTKKNKEQWESLAGNEDAAVSVSGIGVGIDDVNDDFNNEEDNLQQREPVSLLGVFNQQLNINQNIDPARDSSKSKKKSTKKPPQSLSYDDKLHSWLTEFEIIDIAIAKGHWKKLGAILGVLIVITYFVLVFGLCQIYDTENNYECGNSENDCVTGACMSNCEDSDDIGMVCGLDSDDNAIFCRLKENIRTTGWTYGIIFVFMCDILLIFYGLKVYCKMKWAKAFLHAISTTFLLFVAWVPLGWFFAIYFLINDML